MPAGSTDHRTIRRRSPTVETELPSSPLQHHTLAESSRQTRSCGAMARVSYHTEKRNCRPRHACRLPEIPGNVIGCRYRVARTGPARSGPSGGSCGIASPVAIHEVTTHSRSPPPVFGTSRPRTDVCRHRGSRSRTRCSRPRPSASDSPFKERFLEMGDRFGGIEVLRTGFRAVHDRMASIEPEGILQVVKTLARRLVTAIDDPAVSV